jgi:hypothetical protein
MALAAAINLTADTLHGMGKIFGILKDNLLMAAKNKKE